MEIKQVLRSPELYVISPQKVISERKTKEAKNRLKIELLSLGYKKQEGNVMTNGRKIVTFSCSSEYNDRIAIFWKEHWRNNYAHIYDYWAGGGPTCIVPIKELFSSKFIQKKSNLPSHDNNSYFYKNKLYYWWRQKVNKDHELAKLVLKFRERWDLLK